MGVKQRLGFNPQQNPVAKQQLQTAKWQYNPVAKQQLKTAKWQYNPVAIQQLQTSNRQFIPVANSSGMLQNSLTCEICNVTANSLEVFHDHLLGAKHVAMAAGDQFVQQQPQQRAMAAGGQFVQQQPQQPGEILGPFTCDICQITVSSRGNFNDHLLGAKHQNLVSGFSQVGQQNEVEVTEFAQPIEQNGNLNAKGPIVCNICNITVTGQETYKSHLLGTKHQSKIAGLAHVGQRNTSEKGPISCDICDIIVPCQTTYNSHLLGAKHRKMVEGLSQIGEQKTNEKDYFNCGICGISVSGNNNYILHLNGSKHKAKVNKSSQVGAPTLTPVETDFEKYCNICSLELTSAIVSGQHFSGTKHHKKVKEMQVERFLLTKKDIFVLDPKTNGYKCVVCDIHFQPQQLLSLSEHASTIKHLYNTNKQLCESMVPVVQTRAPAVRKTALVVRKTALVVQKTVPVVRKTQTTTSEAPKSKRQRIMF